MIIGLPSRQNFTPSELADHPSEQNSFPSFNDEKTVGPRRRRGVAYRSRRPSATRLAQQLRRNRAGVDAGLTFGVGSSSGTLFSLPTQVFRLGYFLGDKLEFEPRFSINSITGGGNTVSAYNIEAGLLLIPDGDRVGKGLYLRPFVGVAGVSVSGGNSTNAGEVGAGVGLKLPFADRRLATRLEANYEHGFGSGGSNTIGLLAGLSFFTR